MSDEAAERLREAPITPEQRRHILAQVCVMNREGERSLGGAKKRGRKGCSPKGRDNTERGKRQLFGSRRG